jgi:curved DNA-binding protein
VEFKDYYKVMGVSRDATQEEIKRSYRKLARKYHPDVSKERDAEARFKDVGEAYEVLKDPERRAAYDRLASGWQSGQEFRPPPDWDAGFEFSGNADLADAGSYSDFFEALFGRVRSERAHRARAEFRARGQDHHAKVLVDLEDSLHGATRAITLRVPELTPDGRVKTREHTLNVHIPQGVRAGQQIRLVGQGGAGVGKAPAGDLYLQVELRSHPLYRVDGADLYLDLPVAPWEAALGATVQVPTPGGPVDIKVPAGSPQGRRLRLKGRGIPCKEPGDLYVVLQVTLPPADSEQARDLYRKMREELKFNPRAGLGGVG